MWKLTPMLFVLRTLDWTCQPHLRGVEIGFATRMQNAKLQLSLATTFPDMGGFLLVSLVRQQRLNRYISAHQNL